MIAKNKLKKMMIELATKNLDKEKIANYIADLGNNNYNEARKVVMEYIDYDDSIVRQNALTALLIDFKTKDLYEIAKKIAVTDPDGDVRSAALSGIGSIKWATRDKDALQFFLDILLRYKGKENLDNDEQSSFDFVRDSAYRAIFDILGIHPRYSPPSGVFYDRKEYFDLEFLNKVKIYAHKKISDEELDKAIKVHLKKLYKLEVDKDWN